MFYVGAMPGITPVNPLPWYHNALSVAGNFDITNIPQTYRVIRISTMLRHDQASTYALGYLFFNNDTTLANYRSGGHLAGATHTNSAPASNPGILLAVGANDTADYFAQNEVVIIGYTGGQMKKAFSSITISLDGTAIYTYTYSLVWKSTAAINRVTAQYNNHPTNKFVANCELLLELYR